VVSALVQQGVARARLHDAGFGARCPVDPACREATAPASCRTPEQWQADRRVVLMPLQIGNASLFGRACLPRWRGADSGGLTALFTELALTSTRRAATAGAGAAHAAAATRSPSMTRAP
jgi:hypothetical protein